MKPQPTAVRARDALCFAEERNEQKQHEVSVHLRLELEVAREIFRTDLARAVLELERSVQRVIDLFDECDQRTNIVIAQTGAWIVALESVDQPARIINAD